MLPLLECFAIITQAEAEKKKLRAAFWLLQAMNE